MNLGGSVRVTQARWYEVYASVGLTVFYGVLGLDRISSYFHQISQ
jgi:hypothetical protein